MSSTQESDEYVFDLAKYIPKGVSWLWLVVFVIGVGLGFMVSPKPYETTREEKIISFIDNFIDQPQFCMGSLCIEEDFTWSEIRGEYYKFRNQPSAQGMIVSSYEMFCGGI